MATVTMILDGNIWVANAGNNRAILQNELKTIPLTEESNPDHPRYRNGILKRGGFVYQSRTNNILPSARSLGSIAIKHGLNERPKITRFSYCKARP